MTREDRDLMLGWEGSLRPHDSVATSHALPFEDILAPIVARARDCLIARDPHACSLLSRRALPALERELIRLLASLCGEVLYARFLGFSAYAAFSNHMAGTGWDDLRREFPVLEILIQTVVQDWTNAGAEFLDRVRDDFHDVVVEDLEPGLSDRHHGGRAVFAVTFDTGRKFIYKPRSLALEHAFFGLLDWMNRHGAPLESKVVAVLDRPGYGWMEYAAPGNCRDPRGYFARAGLLHCVLYVLYGADAHMGNVVASGDYPVLVDAECLLQPPQDGAPDETPIDAMLRSGLLPRPHFRSGGGHFDLSGIGGYGGQAAGYRVPLWEAVNTYAMTLRFVEAEIAPQHNLAKLEYAADFIAGFRAAYRFLAAHRAALLAPDGPLEAILHQPVRVLFRGTREYVTILNLSLAPDCLRSASRREAALREWCGESSIRDAEVQALERLDIPRFSAPGAVERVTARLRALAEPELGQLAIVIKALFVSALLDRRSRAPAAGPTQP